MCREKALFLLTILRPGEALFTAENLDCADFSAFFFAFPSYISEVHHFWVRFLRMCPFFNPTIKVVTFRFRRWCVLGVFLLPAFTRLGHERQDLLSPCDECMCAQTRPRFILSSEGVFGEWSLNPC